MYLGLRNQPAVFNLDHGTLLGLRVQSSNPNLFPHIKHSKHQHWQQDMIMFQDFRPHRGTYHVLADSELTTSPDILASQSVRDSSKRK